MNSHSLFCSLFLFPRLRAVTSFLRRLLFAVVSLSVICPNGAFWLCRLVAVWRVLFESLSFLFVFLQSVFCQSPRLRTATFLCNDVSVCLCCSMGKCLNYPQTVLSEAIGCVYGIFLSWFFTVPLRVFSVAVFFFTPTLWITPTPQKSLLSATF